MSKHPNFCPCGSENDLDKCCGPLLSGEAYAATAEQLMRSRYTAYVLNNEEYLTNTCHPSTRSLDLQQDEQPKPQWQGLEILQSDAGAPEDEEGTVEFIARFKVNNKAGNLHEKSRFIKEQGRWYYLDDVAQEVASPKTVRRKKKIGRNEPCSCGSGKKYKRCCM